MTATTEANLFSCLRRFAEEAPDRIALIHRGKTLAYGEFRIRVERRAAELRRRGIGKGERIVIFVPMGICLYEILLAVFAVGAVAVFLDAWADPKRLDYAAQLAEAKAYIAVPKAYLLLLRSRALRRIPVRLLPGFGRRRACGGFVPAECSPDDPALFGRVVSFGRNTRRFRPRWTCAKGMSISRRFRSSRSTTLPAA